MPELPEMQALAERLDEMFAGSSLDSVEIIQFSALKTYDPAPESLEGSLIISVGRRGKYLVLDLDGRRMLIHLSQGGRVVIEEPAKRGRTRFGVARLHIGETSVLIKEFGTQRKAGLWILGAGDDGPLAVLGPEPGDAAFIVWVREATDNRRLHTSLRDQRTVAGIGRGFVDDILHHAGLSPYASLKSLGTEQRDALLRAVDGTLSGALSKERERVGGLPDKLPGRFKIHGRTGEPCPRCGDVLRRVSYEDYEIVYCPRCQTGGKLLADRRLSRLVK